MNITGKITGIKYKVLLAGALETVDIKDSLLKMILSLKCNF